MKYRIYSIDPNGVTEEVSVHIRATSATRASEMVKEVSNLLATVPTKECELCLEDSGNHTFDCPRHKRNLNSTLPQLPEIEIIPEPITMSSSNFRLIERLWMKQCQIIDRLNLLSQRVCKEK